MIMSSRAIGWFLGSLLIFSWLFQLAAIYAVGDITSPAIVPWLAATMFIPSLWSIVYLTAFNREAWKAIQFRPGNPTYLIAASLIPAAIAVGVLALMVQQGWATSAYFGFSAAGVNVSDGPWVMGDGLQGWGYFAANIAATAIYFACLNSVFALGEEFGWRGLLQHNTIARLGFFRGVALLGFVWGIWHVPVNIAGYNHPDAPILGALILFPIELTAMSFIMACVTLHARSFWPAVLIHGSTNGIAQGLLSSMTAVEGIPSTTAKIIQIGLIVAVAIICVRLTPAHIRSGQSAGSAIGT